MNDPAANDVLTFWRDYEATLRTGKRAVLAAAAMGVKPAATPASLKAAWDMVAPHIADDYTLVDPQGRVWQKSNLEGMVIRGTTVFIEYNRTDDRVRVSGDTAIYVSLVMLKDGANVTGQYRETHTLMKRQHGWVVVASQMTRYEPQTPHPFAKASKKEPQRRPKLPATGRRRRAKGA